MSRMFERALWSSRLLALVAGVVLALGTFWITLGRRQLGQVVERHVGAQCIPAGSRRAQVFSNLLLGRVASRTSGAVPGHTCSRKTKGSSYVSKCSRAPPEAALPFLPPHPRPLSTLSHGSPCRA